MAKKVTTTSSILSADAADCGVTGGTDGDVVLGEVDAGFEGGDELDQRLLDGGEGVGERAAELRGGDAGLVEGLCVDEVADGFGLGEVEAVVEEGAQGELAGLGEAGAAGEALLDDIS